MDRQKKKGLKIYVLIVAAATALGLLSPHFPILFPLGGGSPDTEVKWEDLDMNYETVETAAWTGFAEEDYPGEEKGMFEFGGSTIVLLLKKDTVEIDSDIIQNSRENVETIVKMGERIGVSLLKSKKHGD